MSRAVNRASPGNRILTESLPPSGDKRRALISVSNKAGVVDFARGLAERGFEIVSTGGTARALAEAGLAVTEVANVTSHPEMMDGRVKTLHPAVHAGILCRRDREDDTREMERAGYFPIDLVAVNLYPFGETVARGADRDRIVEEIDVGGPTLLRAAAKAHRDVWPVPDPAYYSRVLEALDAPGAARLRVELARRTFAHLSEYDSAIAEWFAERSEADADGAAPESGPASEKAASEPAVSGPDLALPPELDLRLSGGIHLRYGENPDQPAAFYPEAVGAGAPFEQLHGKALSYNNLLDLDGALFSLSPFAGYHGPAVCIVKHATPCGIAIGDTVADAYSKALRTDSESAFGSVVAVNTVVDEECARLMSKLFIECIAARGYASQALDLLSRKKNLRLLVHGDRSRVRSGRPDSASRLSLRSVWGGVLAQRGSVPPGFDPASTERSASDAPTAKRRNLSAGENGSPEGNVTSTESSYGWEVMSVRPPSPREELDLRFAWSAVYGVKSNAILIAGRGASLGIGGGQTSRVESARAAVERARRAGLDLTGSVLASDGFFPFRDGVDAAAAVGVTAIVQPGGSKRDGEVSAAADEHGIAMVRTGRRLFRH